MTPGDRTPVGPARLTEEQVAAIEQRAEAATPGPWEAYSIERGGWQVGFDSDPDGSGPVDLSICSQNADATWADAAFIAHARTDVPALLAALRAAWAENARYRTALEHYADAGNWRRTRFDHLMDPADRFVYVPEDGDGDGYDVARAALAAPGAGENGGGA